MTDEDSPSSPAPPRPRWSTPLKIIAVGGVLIGLSFALLAIDVGHRNMAVFSAIALTFALLGLWVARYSHLPWSMRLPLIGLMVAPVVLLRIEGCQGDLTPVVAWRFSPRRDFALAHHVDTSASAAAPRVDLTATTEHDYPRFLGPEGTAQIKNVRLDPDWKARPPREVWRREVGAGWSGFSVVGDYVVTQEQRGDVEAIVCYHLKTGEPVWMHTNPGRHEHTMGGVGPRATPTIDCGIVYTLGAETWLHALNGATGSALWSFDVKAGFDSPEPDWGRSCSPLIVDDLVVVSVGGDKAGLAAFDRRTGKQAWHSGGGPASYATPVLATLGGVRQIVMLNGKSVTAHDPNTGKVLWTYDWPGVAPKVAQPIVIDDRRLLISSGYGYGCKLLEVTKTADVWSVREQWSSRQLNPKFMNPIVYQGHIYGLDDGVAMVCLELETGKRLWKKGRYGHGQFLLVDGLLLVQAEYGDVALVEPNPQEHRELARFTALHDRTWNNPTLVGELLLVRNDREAACYALPLRP